jgi:hypothetical protein
MVANVKNINPSRYKDDRTFLDTTIVAPDFTPTEIILTRIDLYGSTIIVEPSTPVVPGEKIWIKTKIENLNNIAIDNVKVMILIGDEPVMFSCGLNCLQNFTTFDIGAYGTTTIGGDSEIGTTLPSVVGGILNVTVIVNPFFDDIETNYSNNNISKAISTVPSADIALERVWLDNYTVVEGQKLTVYALIKNIGSNKSYYEDVDFYGLWGPGSRWMRGTVVPLDEKINCSPSSPDYNPEMCDGEFNPHSYKVVHAGNLEPGESTIVNYTVRLENEEVRSHGAYNISVAVGNVGSIDENLVNSGNYTGILVVLPSQVELLFDPGYYKEIRLSNPDSTNISLTYHEWNYGGYDAEDYDTLVYLDNNDSNIVRRISDEYLQNHTKDIENIVQNWADVPEGDHVLYFYLDYGKNESETTAKASSKDGLTFIATTTGVKGNGISVKIEEGWKVATQVRGDNGFNSTTVKVYDTSQFSIGDKIAFITPDSISYTIIDINNTSRIITISPGLVNSMYGGDDIYLFRKNMPPTFLDHLRDVFPL